MGGYTVITTMKNEGAFLLEWVAHHKALGFDHLVICTNDCDDPTTRMALRLQEMGLGAASCDNALGPPPRSSGRR